jgi:hypothetical protein
MKLMGSVFLANRAEASKPRTVDPAAGPDPDERLNWKVYASTCWMGLCGYQTYYIGTAKNNTLRPTFACETCDVEWRLPYESEFMTDVTGTDEGQAWLRAYVAEHNSYGSNMSWV